MLSQPKSYKEILLTIHSPVRDYHGYADSTSSDKKIISDVWRRGDRFFRSGDVFVMDELGWLYFKVHNIYNNIYNIVQQYLQYLLCVSACRTGPGTPSGGRGRT